MNKEKKLKKYKILIVDDEPSLSDALYEKFTKEGFLVFEARDGYRGLTIALEEKPDLILLDILMPKVDGFKMLEDLRKDEWGKSAKIIVLTNMQDNEKLDKAVSLGVYGYFLKTDWKLEDLVTKVKEAIK